MAAPCCARVVGRATARLGVRAAQAHRRTQRSSHRRKESDVCDATVFAPSSSAGLSPRGGRNRLAMREGRREPARARIAAHGALCSAGASVGVLRRVHVSFSRVVRAGLRRERGERARAESEMAAARTRRRVALGASPRRRRLDRRSRFTTRKPRERTMTLRQRRGGAALKERGGRRPRHKRGAHTTRARSRALSHNTPPRSPCNIASLASHPPSSRRRLSFGPRGRAHKECTRKKKACSALVAPWRRRRAPAAGAAARVRVGLFLVVGREGGPRGR